MAQQLSSGGLTGPAKLQAVTGLMNKLTQDLKSISLLPQQRDAALEELKIYGRDPRFADPIFSKQGIETLARHAFHSPSNTTARNALRVLCNALFLKAETRQMFVDLGLESKVCNKLKSDNRDDEFLVSRLLFLTTYGTTIDLQTLIDRDRLADTILANLARHSTVSSGKGSKGKADPMEEMAMGETLKLLFNVSHHCPDRVSLFTPAVAHIVAIINARNPSPAGNPLDPPFGSLVNALMNLELKDAQAALSPKSNPTAFVAKLIQMLDRSMKVYKESELEQTVTPLVSVIRSIYEHAPENVKQYIQGKLLPTEEDRQNVLGTSETLTSKLLRNSTNPLAPELRKAISHLFFEMSDKDASKFVKNVGYGFASGFLFNNNLPIPENASEAFSTGSGGTEDSGKVVNPVTGQFLDSERLSQSEGPPMTEEEKEREAERLFVLFERLRKNGIINVQNPVEKAYQEGRIQELPDDDDEDELD